MCVMMFSGESRMGMVSAEGFPCVTSTSCRARCPRI